jgi:hypothetical protein
MPVILFTDVGSGNFLKPYGVTYMEIECWGPGGSGAIRTQLGQLLGGGGGGAYSANMFGLTQNYNVEELVIPYFVADAGSQTATTWGKDSTFPEWNIRNRVRALGGNNGQIGSAAAGGNGLNGDGTTRSSGGSSSLGTDGTTNFGGSGGGAGGELDDGGNAVGLTPGTGSGVFSGTGGQRGVSSPTVYGAGGFGNNGVTAGQAGTQGLIRISFDYPSGAYFAMDNNQGGKSQFIITSDLSTNVNTFRKI